MALSQGWPAPAKINLFLHVTGQRDDGYHCLQTLFQFVDRCDTLDFTLRDDGEIKRESELPGVPPEADLVVRAARLLQSHSATRQGASIKVTKRLPMGGGLGGGSSDAATVLVALNALWKLGLPAAELAALGLSLGADVPVFVHGQAAWAEGVGEILCPLAVAESAIAVVTPECAVETAKVFRDADLTRDTAPIRMHDFSLTGTRNDCEAVTRRLYPPVGAALDWLASFAPSRMSGTGASVFAFFDDYAAAAAVVRQMPGNWSGFAAQRLNRSPLLDRLREHVAQR
jgi:4-diphosphocytidyl-2-C-methyl-D-erythritol kinase